ncbi:adenylate/guanylate cyclase domain-containing protein [Paraburkholderia silvatlantica]|uniref:Class 3 adenylate cyclase/tetratricopeptide (TPR) repeat protein n=1 Tax=Paraburkholderia silvatlantica TaxID=321895 RepID=A0ABR6FQ80_9BURK|nr:adenylate/guanylate cyclase domain-containing protein [Paraburkholderia silvatlantica]MBB2929282.1 class 3 adenylate cyclase/tetratricopeptide (TPR) repeat protein [Paraburkholderia silvatlantica]PVY27307.1 SAM (Sterile alpha motif) domain-containing protein [Paraburkholderia silvatlantica]PXW34336.1 SAM (Sterile alpha motif) domain-containing protein [Paraburkholderia silvatlantica]TDQ85232.1 SAM (Sterile alpha motif) domain-containing protein [Paraburkholderia silvatlantica]
MDIGQWLRALGLEQYAQAFAANDIDLSLLAQLTDADLRELGVQSLGHRKRILAAAAPHPPAAVLPVAQAPAAPGAPEIPADERRQVTILFADLCGFTALSRTLDAEEVRTLIGRFTALVDGIVLAWGGTTDRHIGDAVMALFGAPRAHETDTLRAARAALDIHEALTQLSAQAARTLQAHIGIASGEVVAGALGCVDARDYTVTGSPVNLAARLQVAAAAGETWLSDDVARALGDAAVCDALGEQRFKGIETPVRAWRLRAISSGPASESAKAGQSLFVGREAELEQFHGIVRACVARRAGHVVHVRGEAGIGKTRLVDEMRRYAQSQRFEVHRGLVLDFGVGKGQDPVHTIAGSLLGLPADASSDARQAAAARLAAEGIVKAGQLAFLHDLLDLPLADEWRALYDAMDHGARKRGKQALAARLTGDACRQAPTLIVVEDLHWAEPEVLDYLSAFASGIANGPGLLVTTSRVEGDPIDAAWRARCRDIPFATIDLGPLRQDEALSLAGNFIDATQRVALACIERAGGNPLFLEQLLRNAEEGSGDAVPGSIRSLVLARMDRLAPRDRLAFQAAAVIGQRFGIALLRRLIDDPGYVCDGLLANALVLPEGEEFLFAHALIQESAYSTLLRARRRELHRCAADWFAQGDPTLHAQHLDRAEDERAPQAYLAAALAQRAAHLLEAALRLTGRGLEIAQTETDRHALSCCKGELQRDLGDIAGSTATWRAALAAAPDDASLCRCQLGLAEGLRVSEGLDEALDLLEAAQRIAERDDRVAELASLHYLRGNLYFPLGKIDACSAEHERGLGYARRLGQPEAEARALGGLADAAYAQGRMRTAFRHFSDCVALSREHGCGRIEVANRSMQGFSRIYLNEPRQAREDAVAAVRAAELIGQPRAQLLGETLGVFACYELGDMPAMQVHLEQEKRVIRQLGARRFEAQNLEMQGRVWLADGRRGEAVKALREALAISREVGTQFCAPKNLSALACAVDENDERARLLAEGADLLRLGAVGHNHLWFYRDAIEAMLSVRDPAGMLRYTNALEDYTRREPLPWAEVFAARARALARALQAPTDEAARGELARVRTVLRQAGLQQYLAAVDAALAA